MPAFVCTSCQKEFEVPQASLDKYPGWKPKICIRCRDQQVNGTSAPKARKATKSPRPRAPRGSGAQEENLTLAEVLAKYTAGPAEGIFTDGAANPNPGPGGWGAVYVRGGQVVSEACGHEPHTTNNRMELTALIAGYEMAPDSPDLDVWSDSQLCVNTINQWAAQWEKRGWKRTQGEIKNLELVKRLYALQKAKPNLHLKWIKAHSGLLWNEYADALATAYRRQTK